MPRIEILLFAVARDLAAAESVEIDVELPATAAHILTAIGTAHPALTPWLSSCRLAVDQVYVPAEQV
ncbi:MAG: MoaD/ThiS family protein, partial [Planctomycetaceae bacterium]